MRLLVILPRVPCLLDKGDKLRAFHQLRELSARHEIILFALSDEDVSPAELKKIEPYCLKIEIFRLSMLYIILNVIRAFFQGKPLEVGYFFCGSARDRLHSLVSLYKPQHIYCQLIRTSEYARAYPKIPKTLDYMDVFSKGMERRLTFCSIYLKPFIWMECRRLIKYEKEVFEIFDKKTIISAQDRDLIPHPDRHQIKVIPNGVDADFFKPAQSEKTFALLFNGNMHYPPNVESALYLVRKVMPLVWRSMPTVRLLISGANPTKVVMRLASERVVVSGWVDDVRDSYARSRVLVAPMHLSIGLQNKLLEAMAMGLPCITSSLANNALGARSGEQILIADTDQQFADNIIDLVQDELKAGIIGENGRRYVLRKFSWRKTTLMLNDFIES